LVFRCLSDGPANAVPLYRGVSVPTTPGLTVEDFFGFDWSLAAAGKYTIFMFLTYAGRGDVIAVAIAPISYN
jgi:hypothetical protein